MKLGPAPSLRFMLMRLLPIVLSGAGALYFGNVAYLSLSVAFIQILKVRGLCYSKKTLQIEPTLIHTFLMRLIGNLSCSVLLYLADVNTFTYSSLCQSLMYLFNLVRELPDAFHTPCVC